MGLKKYLVNRLEVLQHLLKHDLFDGKENTEKRNQIQSELLFCGICDEPTMHDTTNYKELICLVCNNVAKE